MLFVVNLLYQRFGAIFMSIHQFVKLFCLNYQAYSPTLLVGKLSEICKEIIHHVKEEETYEGIELSSLDNPLDILNHCWFTTLYICATTNDNDIAYIVEGEGDWGNLIGFAIKNNMLVHVGDDYFDYMEED